MKAVFVLLDSLRPDFLSCYSGRNAKTPNVDCIADKGAIFLNACTSATYTLSSHRSIFASMPVMGHNYSVAGKGFPWVPEILQSKGIATGAVISNAVTKRHSGLDRGFSFFDDAQELKGRLGKIKLKNAQQAVDSAIMFLEKNSGKDSFLFLQLMDTHRPYSYPEIGGKEFLESEGMDNLDEIRGRCGKAVEYADAQIGRLIDYIGKSGMEKDTLVLLSSDHGESLGERGLVCKHGQHFYNEQLLVPLIAAGMGISPGQKIGGWASLLDVAPTVLSHFGIGKGHGMLGARLQDYSKNRTAGKKAFFAMEPLETFRFGEKKIAYGMVSGKWKLSAGKTVKFRPTPVQLANKALLLLQQAKKFGAKKALERLVAAMRENTGKPKHAGVSKTLLFDLETDPHEEKNLASELSQLAGEMEREAWNWAEHGGCMPTGSEHLVAGEMQSRLKGLGYI